MTEPALLILASLADGEKHGYAMMEDIKRFAGVDVGPGTLYGAITRLEERGWIEGLESEDGTVLAVQCHPEELTSQPWARDLFRHFVRKAAGARREA